MIMEGLMAKTIILVPSLNGFFGTVGESVRRAVKGSGVQILVNVATAIKKVKAGEVNKIVVIMGAKAGRRTLSSADTYEFLKDLKITIIVLDGIPWDTIPKKILKELKPFYFTDQVIKWAL